jgi:hypothetical protein
MFTILAGNPAWPFGDVLAQGGWIMMVSGFAVVLWSRLNLILNNTFIRRAVLGMIIFNGVVWHPTMIALSFGRIYLGNEGRLEEKAKWTKVYQPLERVHIVCFNGQEIIIAGLYIHAAFNYLRERSAPAPKVRNAMVLLLLIQAIVVALDMGIIIIDFLGFLTIKLFLNSFIYCVKLELEFVVLNQLVELSQIGALGLISLRTYEIPEARGKQNDGELPNSQKISEPPNGSRGSDAMFASSQSTVTNSPRPSLIGRANSGLTKIAEDDMRR